DLMPYQDASGIARCFPEKIEISYRDDVGEDWHFFASVDLLDPVKWNHPVEIIFHQTVKAKYFRIEATKLSREFGNQGRYLFQLAGVWAVYVKWDIKPPEPGEESATWWAQHLPSGTLFFFGDEPTGGISPDAYAESYGAFVKQMKDADPTKNFRFSP